MVFQRRDPAYGMVFQRRDPAPWHGVPSLLGVAVLVLGLLLDGGAGAVDDALEDPCGGRKGRGDRQGRRPDRLAAERPSSAKEDPPP